MYQIPGRLILIHLVIVQLEILKQIKALVLILDYLDPLVHQPRQRLHLRLPNILEHGCLYESLQLVVVMFLKHIFELVARLLIVLHVQTDHFLQEVRDFAAQEFVH